jgi:hypothetical protein
MGLQAQQFFVAFCRAAVAVDLKTEFLQYLYIVGKLNEDCVLGG